MKIEILYFAYLREQLGFDREEAETPDDVRTVGAASRLARRKGRALCHGLCESQAHPRGPE